MKLSIEIEGLDSWKSLWQTTEQQVMNQVKDAVDEHAHKIEATAKRNAPVDTGRLRGSITTDVESDGYSAETGSNVEYADDVEGGTSKQMPQPFLKPAYTKQEPLFIKDLENIMERLGD